MKTTTLIIVTLILFAGFTTLTSAVGIPDTPEDTQALYADLNNATQQEFNRPQTSGDVNITNLSFYDRDNNGTLDKIELDVVITDALYSMLTTSQANNLIEIIGYYPMAGTLSSPDRKVIVDEVPEELRTEIHINNDIQPDGNWAFNAIPESQVADDVFVTGRYNLINSVYCNTLTVDSRGYDLSGNNIITVRNSDISAITIYGYGSLVQIPSDANPTADEESWKWILRFDAP